MCEHTKVKIYCKEVARQTRYEPAEFIEIAECDECGERLDPSDVANAEVTDTINVGKFWKEN